MKYIEDIEEAEGICITDHNWWFSLATLNLERLCLIKAFA